MCTYKFKKSTKCFIFAEFIFKTEFQKNFKLIIRSLTLIFQLLLTYKGSPYIT